MPKIPVVSSSIVLGLRVDEESECWKRHEGRNPLGRIGPGIRISQSGKRIPKYHISSPSLKALVAMLLEANNEAIISS